MGAEMIYNILAGSKGELAVGKETSKSCGYEGMFTCPVFYMSDLHIESHLIQNRSAEDQIDEIVDKMIINTPLLYGKIQYKDIASMRENCSNIARALKETENRLDALLEKEKLTVKEKKEKAILEGQKSELARNLDELKKEYEEKEAKLYDGISEFERKYIRPGINDFIVIIAGDIANKIEYVSRFFRRLRNWVPQNVIMYVLGNHELSQYSLVDDAISAYTDMCEKERIYIFDNYGGTNMLSPENAKEAKEKGIGYIEKHISNLCFYGGVGFNKFDKIHNADNIVTSADIQNNVEKEIEECDMFIEGYKDALEFAKKNKLVLVVISHYPIRDWMKENECDSMCYYFYGHNHKNEFFESNGAYVFADNQIGYDSPYLSFKYTELLGMNNPFYPYQDGMHDIALRDYSQFYRFCGERLLGTYGECKKIQKKIDAGYSLKMIKRNGYYGFFLEKGCSVCICKGGNYSEISNKNGRNIHYYYKCFDSMIRKYIEVLTPYRTYLEKLAQEIKILGGEGKMHGLIVDYNFTHHVMIDPSSNRLIFYFSPIFGEVMDLGNMCGLLKHVGYSEIETEKRLRQIQGDSILLSNSIEDIDNIDIGEMKHVDISNSPYVYSRYIKNLERIFTSRVLRDWNDDLICEIMTDSYGVIE